VILSQLLQQFRPAELFGGPTAVAIRASHITPRELTLKRGPRDVTDQPRDRSPLHPWITVIEFKDDRIALAAIDAGMSDEVVVNLLTALLAVDRPLRSGALCHASRMRFNKDLDIERAMVIYAHPDDAEFGVAGTVAKWAKAGVEVTYCMVTNGASGSQDPNMTREKLRDIRYAEQREAAKVLGVKNVVFLGYEDGYLYPTLEVRKDVARQVRLHRPDVIITMDPRFRVADEGYVNHPDHIAAGEVALRTINPDASTRQMFPELWRDEKLEPHKPKALFLETLGEGGTVVDISDTMATKIKALLLHRSQLGPEAEEFVKDWNRRTGKAAGYKFGESYRVIMLDRPAAAETKPRRGARSASAASKGGAAVRPSAQRTSRPRAAGARAAKRSGGPARRSR
jgi:LmbE family N-acetylglucosaminyl deacetylase